MGRPSRSLARLAAATLAVAALATAGAPARAQQLAPPPPMDPSAPGAPNAPGSTSASQATQARLNEAEAEDSGRGFELFWLNGEIGGTYADMAQFSSESLQLDRASAGGPFFGLGAGLRFVLLVLGARLRYNALSSYNLWQINGELGLKLPVGSLDFLVGGHGGYSFVGSLGDVGLATSTAIPDAKDRVSIRGLNAGLDLGFDYYVSPMFSVGLGTFGDILFLNRPPVDLPAGFEQLPAEQQDAVRNDPLYQRSGTSTGFQLGGSLRLGLHFGL